MGKYPCCSNVGLRRGPWTPREDSLLVDYIEAHGTDVHWHSLPKKAGLFRSGKSCRQRWLNYLRPGIKRGNITPDEHDLIIRLHTLLGNRWSLIAGRLPGRTDNEIKNYWNTYLSKTLQRKGINLNTHNKVMEPKPEPKPQSDPTPTKKVRKRKIERGKAPNHDHTRVAVPKQERPKLHKPKPIRVTMKSLKRFYEGNGSGGVVTHGKAREPPFWPSDQNPCDGKLMLMEEDLDRGGVGYKIIGGELADLGVREQGATVHPQPSDQGKLYEEYLQYFITDDDGDDCGNQEVDLDSFVQSLLL